MSSRIFQRQAGHLFGNGTATMLKAVQQGSNASTAKGEEGTSVDGIGGWTAAGELGLLVTAFSPFRKTADGAPCQVIFDQPDAWCRRTPYPVPWLSVVLPSTITVTVPLPTCMVHQLVLQ